MPNRKWTDNDLDRVATLLRNGHDFAGVAVEFDISANAAQKRWKRAVEAGLVEPVSTGSSGVPTRSFSRMPPAVPDSAPHPPMADEHAEPPAQAQALVVKPRDRVAAGGERVQPRMTIVCGDQQWGEGAFMLDCWENCFQKTERLIEKYDPQQVDMHFVGDMTTGGGVFRNQELSVLLPTTEPQVAYAAQKLMEARRRLGVTKSSVVPGNHDKNQGHDHTALDLVYLLHVVDETARENVRYHDRRAFLDLSPDGADPFVLMMEHGYGHSSYYANSYSFIRGIWKTMIELQADRSDEPRVRRIVCGHTHWLNIGHHLGGDVYLDTVGGWTRNERQKISGGRPVGWLVYTHFGDEVVIEKVTPSQDVLYESKYDPHLHHRNLVDVGKTLMGVTESLMQVGVLADGWPSTR